MESSKPSNSYLPSDLSGFPLSSRFPQQETLTHLQMGFRPPPPGLPQHSHSPRPSAKCLPPGFTQNHVQQQHPAFNGHLNNTVSQGMYKQLSVQLSFYKTKTNQYFNINSTQYSTMHMVLRKLFFMDTLKKIVFASIES